MSPLQVLLVATVAWVIWIPAVSFESQVRGKSGSISIFPVIPLFPLVAWGLAHALQYFSLPLGVTVLGYLHVLYIVTLVISIVISAIKLRRRKREGTGT
jgi:hypothetical protein